MQWCSSAASSHGKYAAARLRQSFRDDLSAFMRTVLIGDFAKRWVNQANQAIKK